MTYLLDVNVWLALATARHQHHPRASAWMNQQAPSASILFCRITQMGLLRLLTNRHVMGDELLPARDAWGIYDVLRTDRRIGFQEEGDGLESHWRLLCQSKIAPASWTDLYLLAFARSLGATLVTFDSALGEYEGVVLVK